MTSAAARRRLAALATPLALVAAVALAGVAGLLVLGRIPTGRERDVAGAGLVAAAVAAALAAPARRAGRRAADRVAGRTGRSPEAVLARFGDRVARGVPVDDLLLEAAEALRSWLGLTQCEIWTAEGARLNRVVAVPDRASVSVDLDERQSRALARVSTAGEAWTALWAPSLATGRPAGELRVVPARHGDAVLGVLVAERAPRAERLTAAEDRVLGEFGRRLAELLRARQLDQALRRTLDDLRVANAELRASRARLVAAADAERRRIERNLHDGAQQALVALAVKLGVVRDTLATDPAVVAALDQLTADVRDAVQQVRDLAHGVYPALLVDSGVAAALRAATRATPGGTFHGDDAAIGRGPSDVEAAVYFCCLEALQNATKHAPGAPITVSLHQGGDVLAFEVVDRGPGLPDAVDGEGHGLQSMADRIGAAGGTVVIEDGPAGGVRVHGTVPWRSR